MLSTLLGRAAQTVAKDAGAASATLALGATITAGIQRGLTFFNSHSATNTLHDLIHTDKEPLKHEKAIDCKPSS